MESLKQDAYAKINLGLDVIRRKENGYHEVRMIMQTISLRDVIELEKRKEKGIWIQTNKAGLPTNEKNLAFKGAKLLFEEFDLEGGIAIRLEKNIPIAAGMAGGSTDGAAVLRGMNQMYGLNLSTRQLMERAIKLGADVPYCIVGGAALAEGIGEILTPLPLIRGCHVLVAKPDVRVSTKWVYDNLNANELKEHPDIDGMMDAMKRQDIRELAGKMGNVLETVTIKRYPVIQHIKERMMEHHALQSMMSGSGPTVFGIFSSERDCRQAHGKLKSVNKIKEIYQCEMISIS